MKFKIGDKVSSRRYGTGTVVGYNAQDDYYEVKYRIEMYGNIKVVTMSILSENLELVETKPDNYSKVPEACKFCKFHNNNIVNNNIINNNIVRR